jgi:hypothetical protein
MEKDQKKEFSQNERQFINQAKRFIRQTGVAVKNFRMFGDGHPILAGNIQNLNDLLITTLTHRDSITYTFLGNTLLVEDIRLKDLDRKEYTLIAELDECGITSLSFQQGITEKELCLLLQTIAAGPEAIAAEGGLASLFQKKNITHIKADETFFKRVSKKDEESKSAKDQLADILIVDYLTGKSSLTGGDTQTLAERIRKDPDKIGKLISENALHTSGSTENSEFNEDGYIEAACASIEKLTADMKNSGIEDSEITVDLENIISSLEPSLRRQVLSRASSAKNDTPLLNSVITEFSDRAITEIIVSDFVDKKLSITETRQLIRKLLTDEIQRKRIMATLEQTLLQKGISQDTCSLLFEGTFWTDMVDEEKVNQIKSHPPLYPIEIGLSDEITNLIRDLLCENKFQAVLVIINKLLNNLLSDDDELKIRFLRDFGEIAAMLFRANDYPYKRKFLNRLREERQNTFSKNVQERFSDLFASLLKISIEEKWYTNLPFLLHVTDYEIIKSKVFPKNGLELFLRDLLFKEKLDNKTIATIIQEIGDDAQETLCEILFSIKSDDFDSYRKRCEIAAIAKASGNIIELFFMDKLSSNDLETIRISLEILSEIGTTQSIPAVTILLEHENARVSEHAKVVLKDIQKRSEPEKLTP